MYTPTASSIRLCTALTMDTVCPEPTEEMGVMGVKYVRPAAGTTISRPFSSWQDFMILVDPYTVINEDSKEDGTTLSTTHYRSSFAYTAYYLNNGDGKRIQEFPVTGKYINLIDSPGLQKTCIFIPIVYPLLPELDLTSHNCSISCSLFGIIYNHTIIIHHLHQ